MHERKLKVDWKRTADELHARYRQERNVHIAKRLQALTLLRRGTAIRQVAHIVGVSRMSIHKWLTWSRTGGLDELTRRTRGGNRIPVRPLLTPDQQAQLIQHAATQAFARSARQWCGASGSWALCFPSVRCDGCLGSWGSSGRHGVRW
jgi:hypothetical protein